MISRRHKHMKYYKVKKEADQKRRKDGSIYIAEELYTEKEAIRQHLNSAFMEPVEISKSKIYWFFGARFEI